MKSKKNAAVYNSKSYSLSNLTNDIALGNIALPDLQRPFVWDSSKVRDLIDSIYKGLPVGLIVLWEILESKNYKDIGYTKEREPRFLVIDGQQRLTSLFSIINNEAILNKNYDKKKIKIAFNPIERKFEVWNAAIEKDVEWISDISSVFDNEAAYSFIKNYFKNLKSKLIRRDVNEDTISSNIERLKNVLNYPFPVLELSSDLDPEEVSEIFVRINSQGKTLNQSDFILTLMAVYWDEGRKNIEEFCEKSRKIPEGNIPSSYNLMNIQPNPENIVRTIVSYSFLRGRLRYAYLILKGRNLENKTISIEERNKNFEIFQEGQEIALDLTNWHQFIKLIHSSGFITDNLVSSKVTFYLSYALYLLGNYKFSIPKNELEMIIRKWFIFSLITQRYTRSPESIIEKDLTSLRKNKLFSDILEDLMKSELTRDYWEITLPQRLDSSYVRNQAYLVYLASQVYENSNVLFSDVKIRDYIDPIFNPKKKTLDVHHIFPRNYLKQLGIDNRKDYNQVANLIHIEYQDNINISDKPPKDYWSDLTQNLSLKEQSSLLKIHDLPENFWELDYFDFIDERRALMANAIKNYFDKF